MQWFTRLFCFLGMHQYQPIRQIWVQHHQPLYFDGSYAREGENITTKLYCPHCGDVVVIEVDKEGE